MSEICPFCRSTDTVKVETTVTSDKYVCRSCKRGWKKTHVGGQIIEIGGAILSGLLAFLWMFGGGDDNT